MLSVEQIPVGALGTNCYLVWDEDASEGVVVDPGDNTDRILARIREHGLTITAILATHCHFDHVGAVAPLKRELGCEFVMHKDEIEVLHRAEASAAKWGFSVEQPPDPDAFMGHGDEIPVGRFMLLVLHTPGHSPGGVSLHYKESVFVGDCLFQRSIGRTDFEGGSFEVLEKSIKERLYTLPDKTIVYTGHGSSTTIGDEKRYNPFVKG